MSGYSIIRYWSIQHGCKVARVSMCDHGGREYFRTVPLHEMRGPEYEAKLNAVLDEVQDAIDSRRVPGDVNAPILS